MQTVKMMLVGLCLSLGAAAQDLIIEASGSTGSTGRIGDQIISRVVEIDRADITDVFNSGSPGPLIAESRRYYAGYFQYGNMKGVYTRGEWQPLPQMTWTLFDGRTSCGWSQGFPGNQDTARISQSGNYNQTRPQNVCEFTCPAGVDNPFGINPRPWSRVAYCNDDAPFTTITVVGTEFFVSTFDADRWRALRMDGDAVSSAGDLFAFLTCWF